MSRTSLLLLLLAVVPTQAQLFQLTGYTPLGQSTYYTIADFNLDGRPDLARASALTGMLTVSLGTVDGSFAALAVAPTSIDTPAGLVSGDFDNDGKMDVAVLSGGLFSSPATRVFLGSGTGTFSPRPVLLLPNFPRAAAAGDFDQDGNLDIALVSITPGGVSTISLLLGNGKGDLTPSFFIAPTTIQVPAGSVFGDIEMVDLNGDRRPDLVMTVSSPSGVGLITAIGDGKGSFSLTVRMGSQPSTDRPNPRFAVADFNGDRSPDLVMFGYLRDQVTLWLNSGGVLVPQIASAISVGTSPFSIVAADFDLDGRMDWAVGRQVVSGTPELHVALGNGVGGFTFASGSPFTYGGLAPELATGDFNGDRRQDLLVAEGDSEVFRILLNIVPRPPTLLSQEIQFAQPPNRGINDGILALTATASSGMPVTFASLTNAVCTVSKGIVTMVALGQCTILAIQSGDSTYSPAPIVQRSFRVTQNTQTITFAGIADRALDASPFGITATASSGLPVTFTASPATVCTVSSSTVTLISVGDCSITASQAGNTSFPAATPVTRTFSVTPVIPVGPLVQKISNAASYATGTLAPASFGVLFGVRLTNATLKLRDATGVTRTPELTFSGPTQINFIVPADVALGAATVVVTTSGGVAEFPVTIAATAPGLFSADFSGSGLAAAQALIVNNDKTLTTLTVGDGPIPVRGGTEIYLVLYGTGIRAHTSTGVFITVAGTPVQVLYAGPQGTYPALDQINVRVPLTVGGFGNVDIRLFVDGASANVVTATFQ